MGVLHVGRRGRTRRRLVTGLVAAGLIVTVVPTASPVAAQDLPEVPRNKTFIFSPWGLPTRHQQRNTENRNG